MQVHVSFVYCEGVAPDGLLELPSVVVAGLPGGVE
jgi:hypothetical protein